MRRRGFTLIELLIIMAIIAVLSAVAIAGYRHARVKGGEAVAVAGLQTINQAQFSFSQTCGDQHFSPTLAGLAVPGSAERRLYGEFITRNPAFFARTERRVVSYWSCYYRWKYPVFGAYPGGALMEAFRAAASEQLGARWPRHTPPPLRVA